VAVLYFGMLPTTQVDSAFYSPWDGQMSTVPAKGR